MRKPTPPGRRAAGVPRPLVAGATVKGGPRIPALVVRPFVAFAMVKGGPGKTTLAVGVAAEAVALGLRPLVVDLDPQANASRLLGLDPTHPGTLELLTGAAPLAAVVVAAPALPGVLAIGARLELGDIERQLDHPAELAALLEGAPADLVILDTPPGPGLLQASALVSATLVVVPVTPGALELDGLATTRALLEALAPATPWRIAVNRYDRRSRMGRELLAMLEAEHPGRVLSPPVPGSIKVAEAQLAGRALRDYAPNSPAALALSELAGAIVEAATHGR